MNQALLLSHFNRISDAPDAVPRLRSFIRDLAVRGKLIVQNCKDELSHELQAKCPDASDDLPSKWLRGKVGKLLKLQYGTGLPDNVRQEKGPVPVYGSNGIVAYTAASLTENPAIIIGRKGSAGALNLCPGPSWTTDVAYFVESPPFFDMRFLFIELQTLHLDQLGKGVKPGLSRRDAYDLELVVPPLAEQGRIVAKVDELMALCDRLEATQRERETRRDRLTTASHHHLNNGGNSEAFRKHSHFYIKHFPRLTARPEQIPALRRSILSLAVRGQVVSQNPTDEPASVLLKRLRAEIERLVSAGEAKEQKRFEEGRSATEPYVIPQTWVWVSLGQVAFGFRYGTSMKCSYERTGEPVLRIPNIDNGRINVEDLKFGPLPKREADALRLRLGDILMVRSNGSLNLVGRPALVESNTVGYCYAGYLVRVRTSNIYLDARYLLLALSSAHVRDQIEIPIRTTVGLKNVNATELSSLMIPLPPLEEQHRIVAKVDEMMAVCDRLEAQLTTAQAESGRLLEAILHGALSETSRRA